LVVRFRVDVEALERARPDIVVTQDLCEVCAVSSTTRPLGRAIDRAAIVKPPSPAPGDILEDVRRVGNALAVAERAEAVVSSFESRIDSVRRRAEGLRGGPS
jgi:iron complex transport system substrate-binding protein